MEHGSSLPSYQATIRYHIITESTFPRFLYIDLDYPVRQSDLQWLVTTIRDPSVLAIVAFPSRRYRVVTDPGSTLEDYTSVIGASDAHPLYIGFEDVDNEQGFSRPRIYWIRITSQYSSLTEETVLLEGLHSIYPPNSGPSLFSF
jgi:hypothetical protein